MLEKWKKAKTLPNISRYDVEHQRLTCVHWIIPERERGEVRSSRAYMLCAPGYNMERDPAPGLIRVPWKNIMDLSPPGLSNEPKSPKRHAMQSPFDVLGTLPS